MIAAVQIIINEEIWRNYEEKMERLRILKKMAFYLQEIKITEIFRVIE